MTLDALAAEIASQAKAEAKSIIEAAKAEAKRIEGDAKALPRFATRAMLLWGKECY